MSKRAFFKVSITLQKMGVFQIFFYIPNFSLKSTSVPNFIEIQNTGVTHLLIWHGMTLNQLLIKLTSR